MTKKITPEEKLMKAIYGDKYKTEAEQEAEYERIANSVTPEEFERVWGVSIEEHTDKMMWFIRMVEAVTEFLGIRNLKCSDLNMRNLADMASYFYNMGKNHIDPIFKVGDVLITEEETVQGITEGLPVVVSVDVMHQLYRCNNETIPFSTQGMYSVWRHVDD